MKTKPNDVRRLVNELNQILADENKLVICNLQSDGSFTVKRNNKHGTRILNVEKNAYGDYFIKFYPFLDMSEGHTWAVRDMEYATYKTPTVLDFRNFVCFGEQLETFLEANKLNGSNFDVRNNENTLGIFLLDRFNIGMLKNLLLKTIIAHREQLIERNKAKEATKKLTEKRNPNKRENVSEVLLGIAHNGSHFVLVH